MEKYLDSAVLGERLRTAREAAGMTREQVYTAIGVTKSTMSHYELGKRVPPDDTKVLICNLLGLTVSDLFFSDNPIRAVRSAT